MLAPNQVSAPEVSQTSSMPPNDGTALLTSDGCTKIDEPTIVPTTIAVAWVRPMERSSLEDIRSAKAFAPRDADAFATRDPDAFARSILTPSRDANVKSSRSAIDVDHRGAALWPSESYHRLTDGSRPRTSGRCQQAARRLQPSDPYGISDREW